MYYIPQKLSAQAHTVFQPPAAPAFLWAVVLLPHATVWASDGSVVLYGGSSSAQYASRLVHERAQKYRYMLALIEFYNIRSRLAIRVPSNI